MADVARPLGHHVEVFLQVSKELFDALAFSVDFLFLGKDVLRVVRPERIGAAHHLVSDQGVKVLFVFDVKAVVEKDDRQKSWDGAGSFLFLEPF